MRRAGGGSGSPPALATQPALAQAGNPGIGNSALTPSDYPPTQKQAGNPPRDTHDGGRHLQAGRASGHEAALPTVAIEGIGGTGAAATEAAQGASQCHYGCIMNTIARGCHLQTQLWRGVKS